jgi:hypothetical protein
MTASIIPFERPTVAGTSPYEIVEIAAGIMPPVQYLVALAGPRASRETGRLPWDSLGWFDAAEAVDVALSASHRHGAIPIWDGAGILAPELGTGFFTVTPEPTEPGDAA